MTNIHQKIHKITLSILTLLILSTFAGKVMTWVPPYYIPESKQMLSDNFGGMAMKDGLDYLALQFWVPNGSQASYPSRYSYAVNDNAIKWFRDWGQANNVKVLLCVFNGENGWDWALAKNSFKYNRSAFIQSLISEMERHNLDGIEIDLEGPNETDSEKNDFMAFMNELSQEVKARGKILTIATFAYIWNAPNSNWWNDLVPIVDAITSMGYQEIGSNASGWASYSTQKTLLSDPTKLMLGMPSDAANGGYWQGNTALEQVQATNALGDVGVAIWDCALQHNAWQTQAIWQELSEIKGTTSMQYSISASAGSNGSITPSGTISVNEGSSITYSITANAGYEVLSLTVDNVNVGALTSYQFSNVTSSHSIHAEFKQTVKPQYLIQASSGNNGTISPSGNVYVLNGANQTFIMEPNQGFEVDDVVIDNNSIGAVSSYTFNAVSWDHSINVSFKQTVDPCVELCSYSDWSSKKWYSPGTRVIYNGYSYESQTRNRRTQPDLNYGAGQPWKQLIDCNCDNPQSYIITSTANNYGSISPAGAIAVAEGENKTFTITPDANTTIDYVLVDGVNVGAVTSYTFSSILSDHTIEVFFNEPVITPTYSITASSGSHGSITPSGETTVEEGQSLEYSFSANSGYQVDYVTIDGISQGALSSYTFTNVSNNHTIAVYFTATTAPTYTITASAGANGSISPEGTISVVENSNQQFTFSANSGYEIDNVIIDGVSNGPLSSYTFTNINSNHTINVSFVASTIPTYTITTAVNGNGTMTPAGNVTVTEGSSQTFMFTPDNNNHIDDVVVNGTSQGVSSSYTFNNISQNHSLVVTFAVNSTGGACDNVDIWDANQSWTEYSANDLRVNNNKLWKCINVAYSFYEPSGLYGHYGWELVSDCN